MKKKSVNDRTDGATVNTSATCSAVITDRVLITNRGDRTDRAGVNTGATSNTIFGNLQGHLLSLRRDD
jgi:hypothetical protein